MWHDIKRIAGLAWPVLIGQLAVIAFGVMDTAMVGRASAFDLASLALGGSIYITVYVGLMGILVALSPIAAQLFGAGERLAIGEEVRQAFWLALFLAVPGFVLLMHPGLILQLSEATPELEARASAYLQILAFGLPAALLFRVYSSLSTAVGQPRIVMAIQVTGLALKVPLNLALIYGVERLGIPALGSTGCAIATTSINWVSCALGLVLMARHPKLREFGIFARFCWPHWQAIRALLKLGVPMGLSYLIEVTAFSFMAIFIARLGDVTLAGHQIAANLGALLYMLPMSIAIATATLTAQAIGSRDFRAAHLVGRRGVEFAGTLGVVLASIVWLCHPWIITAYTSDAMVAAVTTPLLAMVAAYHVFDALQVSAVFVLRAWKVAVVPTVIYAVSLWGVGLGGGYVLGFDVSGMSPASLHGAAGFWFANTASLAVAAFGLLLYLRWVVRAKTQ
ncbi:MATE family efflux transporter [Pandoraea nosoerga]|uniref:Multidrug-efflux transporter n=1 Tax=Pandoraea nosoerga TaxID=2508296 RepID=A0A5E4V5X2_9BURK|nr:MATE family efflux transporter [Pandoraea nosoerga]MBN4665719.1 MATE family efflux transporter [Pandoraea nosoerga]MBN4677426.1 MATE family efflux transporter [Pandoraea nosoerga]MBN4681035.1 MATE family efflux transporter [Pandoraea nosoerga]MBN4746675.1 MATE family efflux transporter [Pandoraea nosoerga]VVE06789.1 multidrug transporter MatE [Pandoraea nosoerga]